MPYKDLRDFLARLEQEGELQRIKEEVDWNLEAGAILRQSHEAGLPAPFFEKVKDYPSGYRLCGGILAKHRRVAIAMDMKPDTPIKELMEEYLRRKRKPLKPVLVKDGPCKENVHIGDEVDLFKFPVPLIHGGDGGRYAATFHLDISKDLDSDWVNWGMYRGMLHNKNTLGICADPHTHLGGMYSKSYEPRNKTMKVAIAIGVEPISSFCAAIQRRLQRTVLLRSLRRPRRFYACRATSIIGRSRLITTSFPFVRAWAKTPQYRVPLICPFYTCSRFVNKTPFFDPARALTSGRPGDVRGIVAQSSVLLSVGCYFLAESII